MDALHIIKENFSPATKDNFTGTYTTNEISQIIFSHTGTTPTTQELFTILSENNFSTTFIDGQLKWMFKFL